MNSASTTDPHKIKLNDNQPQSDMVDLVAHLLVPNDKVQVHIACVECRSRKVKCGGEKPKCLRCERRKESTCTYDDGPRRRGPDRRPGTRHRTAGGSALVKAVARKRKRGGSVPFDKETKGNSLLVKKTKALAPRLSITTTSLSPNAHSLQVQENEDQVSVSGLTDEGQQLVVMQEASDLYTPSLALSTASQLVEVSQQIEPQILLHELPPSSRYTRLARDRPEATSLPAYHQATFAFNHPPFTTSGIPSIIREPSLQFSRDIWWDTLISLYGPTRSVAIQNIYDDLDHLFRVSSVYWAFIYLPLFYSCIHSPEARAQMQPALILSMLALSTFLKSSELGLGAPGRSRALNLLEQAQSAFAASYNSGWIDSNLAQAAWVIAQFECSSHPNYSHPRATSAMELLDNTIFVLQLTRLDQQNPNAPRFGRNQVPSIPRKWPTSIFPPISGPLVAERSNAVATFTPSDPHLAQPCAHATSSTSLTLSTSFLPQKCPCETLSLLGNEEAHRVTPHWLMAPNWPAPWSTHEILQEQDRRLVWSSLTLAAAFNAAVLSGGMPLLDLHIIRPENYALLFSGETLFPSYTSNSKFSGKDSTWALQSRAMLLWSVCPQVRKDRTMTSEQKGEFAFRAWVETMAIEEALNEHDCGGEKSTLYQAREQLTNIRMFITHEYHHAIPVPQTGIDFTQYNRAKIVQWLHHQHQMTAVIITGKFGIYSDATPGLNLLVLRPHYVWWFLGQAGRCLQYWRMDRSLGISLDVAVKLIAVIDYLLDIWPCPEASRRAAMIRFGLSNACHFAGKLPPPPLHVSSTVQSFRSDRVT